MWHFLKRLWHHETRSISLAAILMASASLVSRLAGLWRDRLLASTFGAGHELDSYYAAFRVPDLLYNLIILGALTSAFIPVFSEYLEQKGDEAAWRLAEQVMSLVGAALIVFGFALALAAPWFIPFTVPGFSGDKLALTIQLSRIMFISPFFLGISAVMGGILQATRRFFAYALAPVFYNLGIIFGIVALVPRLGMFGVAWGVVIGAAMHLLIQASVALRLGMRRLPLPSWRRPGLKKIFALMAPRTAGLAVTQMNLVVLLALASSLRDGSVAVFNLANNLQSVPLGLIGISYAIAAFPVLSRTAVQADRQSFSDALLGTARKIIFLSLPVVVLLILLRAQVVRLVLGQGRFHWDDTIRTISVLQWFAVSLVFQCLVPLFARAFYALQDTWTPFWIGVAAEIVNIALAYLLRGEHGIAGLAMSFSAAAFLQAGWLWFRLRQRYFIFARPEAVLSIIKTACAGAACLLVGYLLRELVGSVLPLRMVWQVALQVGVSGLGGGLAFLAAAYFLKSEEFQDMQRAWSRRLPVSKAFVQVPSSMEE